MCHNPMDGCLPFLAPSSASTQTTSSSSWLPHLHRPPSLAPGVSTAKGQLVRRHIHLLSITIVFVSSFKGKSTLLPCRNSQARLRSSSSLGDPVSSLCAGSRPDRERSWTLGPVSAKHGSWMSLACPHTVREGGHLLCGFVESTAGAAAESINLGR